MNYVDCNRQIFLAFILLVLLCGTLKGQSEQKEKSLMDTPQNEKPLLRVPNTYLAIISKTETAVTYLTDVAFALAEQKDAGFSVRYTTLEIREKMETQLGRFAVFYREKEHNRYKISTETFSINLWNTKTELITDNEGATVLLSSLEPQSISYSSSFETTFSDDQIHPSMQAYRFCAGQEGEIIGKWRFSSPDCLVLLEFKQGCGVEYYKQVTVPQNPEQKNENWLRGTYTGRMELKNSFEIKAIYSQAEYSPYGFENGLPTSYAVMDTEFKAFILIELQDKNTLKVLFDYDRTDFADDWKKETLIMKRVLN